MFLNRDITPSNITESYVKIFFLAKDGIMYNNMRSVKVTR